jgi:hypothetical protein
MKRTLLWVWLLTAPYALAGNEAGNGGYTVQCDHPSPDGYTIEVLDYHEIRVRFPPHTFTVDLGSSGDEWDRVRYALKRLSRLDPKRAAAYQDKADHFLENANLVAHANLPDPGDSGPVYLEVGCHAVPTVIQYHGHVEEQKLYTINQDLYEALSPNHRAGLILHEIIYGEAIANGAQTSQDSRYVNDLISSAEIAQMSQGDYQQRMIAIGFDSSPMPQHPIWSNNPVTLPDAIVGIPYQQSLRGYVYYSGGATLRFNLINGPSWLQISSDGILSGTPVAGDVGAATFSVALGDGSDAASIAGITLAVDPSVSVAWVKNPIDLGVMEAGNAFSFDLSGLVSANGAVSFSMTGAPSWMVLSASGQVSGTPGASDIGSYALEVTATDSLGNRATAKVTVAVAAATWTFSVREGQSLAIDLDQAQYEGADAGPDLRFSISDAPAFASLTAAGLLTLRPGHADIGAHTMTVRVVKGDSGTVRTLTVQVTPAAKPPVWNQDPIPFQATVGQLFSTDLGQDVIDPLGGALALSLLSGPSWLSLGSNGGLTGTPTAANVGTNTFEVSAVNSEGMQAVVTVVITVTGG